MLTPEQRAADTPPPFADLIERLEQSERDFEAIVKHLTPWFFGFGGGKERMAYIASGVQQDLTDALQALRTLAAENETWQEYAREASIALVGLSGGGSEMFKRIGEEYYAEPDLCRSRVEEKMRHRQALEKNSADK